MILPWGCALTHSTPPNSTQTLLRRKRYILMRYGREEKGRGRKRRGKELFNLAKRALFLQLYKFPPTPPPPDLFKLSCRFFLIFLFNITFSFYTEMDITQQIFDGLPFRREKKKDFTFSFSLEAAGQVFRI